MRWKRQAMETTVHPTSFSVLSAGEMFTRFMLMVFDGCSDKLIYRYDLIIDD